MNSKEFHIEFEKRLVEVERMMNSTNKSSVLFILQVPNNNSNDLLLPYTRESISNIICFVEISDESEISYILEKSKGLIDRVVIDIDKKRENSDKIIENIKENLDILYYTYSDLKMWAEAATNFLSQTTNNINEQKLLLIGNSFLTTRVLLNLLDRGLNVYMFDSDYNDGVFKYDYYNNIKIDSKQIILIENLKESDIHFDILLGTNLKEEYNNNDLRKFDYTSIYDIGLNNFTGDFIKSQIECDTSVFRFDNRAGVSSIILNLMETEYLIKYNMGKTKIGSINVVSGGIMGRDGDIVVDNVYNPSSVLGVANGSGTFKHDYELTNNDLQNICSISKLVN